MRKPVGRFLALTCGTGAGLLGAVASGEESLSVERVVEQFGHGVATIVVKDSSGEQEGLGSGFCLQDGSLLVTAAHVVSLGGQMEAEFPGKTRRRVKKILASDSIRRCPRGL